MAYVLKNNGIDTFCQIPAKSYWMNIGQFRFGYIGKLNGTSINPIGNDGNLNNTVRIQPNQIRFRYGAVNVDIVTTTIPFNDDTLHEIIVDRDAVGVHTAYLDGNPTPIGSATGTAQASQNCDALFRSSTTYSDTDCNRLWIEDAPGGTGTLLWNWSADDSDHSAGAQPQITETVNGDNGQGVGYPTDGSAYENLGGGTSFDLSIASTLPALTSSVSLTQSIPSYYLEITSTLPKLTSVAVFSQSAPEYDTAITSTLPSLISSVSLQQAPPGNNISISSTLPALTSSVDLSQSQPVQKDLEIASTLPMLQSSVALYNGIIDIVVGEGNNIDIVVQSRNIDKIVKSRNIG